MDPRDRVRQVRFTMLWVLGANLAVALAKGIYGYLSGSVSVSSDAIHSALDGSANIIGLVGLGLAAAPADMGHPYGHRKFEIVASAGVGLLIFAGGYELGRAAVLGLLHGSPPPPIGPGGFLVVLATILTNAWVSRTERRAGKRLDSPFLIADSQHTMSDMMASIAVLLAFVGARLGVRWADPLGGLVVLAMVLRVGVRVLRENVQVLVDAAAVSPARVKGLAAEVPGVSGVHRIRSRGTAGAAHLDLHLLVDPEISVRAAHTIAHALEDRLRDGIPGLVDVTIHVEPEGDPEEQL